MRKDDARINLIKELRGMNGGNTLLVTCPSEDLQLNINTTAEYLMERKKLSCIYFCLNKPHATIERIFKERGLDTQKSFFIDCSTALTTTTIPPSKRNVAYVSSPANLTGVGVAIKQVNPALLKNGFIVIDALRTLQIYNRPEAIGSFIQMLISFANLKETRIIAFTITSHDPLFKKVSPLFKRVVELGHRL